MGDLESELSEARHFMPDGPAGRAHEDLVREYTKRYAHGLRAVCSALHGLLANERLELHFRDVTDFCATGAMSSPQIDGHGFKVFPIMISLGMAPPTIGLESRVAIRGVKSLAALLYSDDAHGDIGSGSLHGADALRFQIMNALSTFRGRVDALERRPPSRPEVQAIAPKKACAS